MKHLIFYILSLCTLLLVQTSCEQQVSQSPNAHLDFSADTVRFDTVFTNMNTTTLKLIVRNPQKDDILIERIQLREGTYFQINVDGESAPSHWHDITIAGKDSIYIFIRANINTQDSDNPVLIEDIISFILPNKTQQVVLEAHGQDVEIFRQHWITSDTTLLGLKPYLVYDYLALDTACTLTIAAGSTFYMHDNAQFYVFGNLNIDGTLEQPVRVRGDRLDDILVDVPFDYVSGRWGSIYLVQPEGTTQTNTYDINYLEVNSGIYGLVCLNSNMHQKSYLRLLNSRIHNFAQYGLYLQNTDASVANCEISNCASYCVYLAGGEHQFIHNTIASYFVGNNIQPVGREDVAAVYINNLSKQYAKTTAFFYNNIITGIRQNNVVLATPLPDKYLGDFRYNYLKVDTTSTFYTLHCGSQYANVFAGEKDTVFRNTHFTLDAGYFDFSLDSVSPARGVASESIAEDFPLDRQGFSRLPLPDAGCYQWQPDSVPAE